MRADAKDGKSLVSVDLRRLVHRVYATVAMDSSAMSGATQEYPAALASHIRGANPPSTYLTTSCGMAAIGHRRTFTEPASGSDAVTHSREFSSLSNHKVVR